MTETLPVHINRSGTHAIEAPPSFRATGPFVVELHNHGPSTHVHVHLDDDLSRVAAVGADNHYVEQGSPRPVEVRVRDAPRPVEGRLKLVTGYGKETAYVAVDVEEPRETDQGVAVDESLGRPKRPDLADTDESPLGALATFGALTDSWPVVALGGVAVLLALVALAVSDAAAVGVGVLAVLAGVVAAAAFLREDA